MSHHVSFPAYKKDQHSEPIDRAVLNDLKAVLGEEGSNTLADLIDLFLADAPSRLREIRQMGTSGAIEALHHNVSALHGWCETLGAREMACCCKRMELFLDSIECDREVRMDREVFSQLFHDIEDAFARAASELVVMGAEY